MASPIFTYLLEAVFPRSCLGCRRSGTLLCSRCGPHQALPGLCSGCGKLSVSGFTHPRCARKTALDAQVALGHYADPIVQRALKLTKYSGVQELALLLGARLGLAWMGAGLRKPATLVPIPLHWSRERPRGFNQAALIARGMAVALRLPVAPCLTRTKHTAPQSQYQNDDRRSTNIYGAFSVRRSVPERVILVDDITTSGSTLEEAAHVLRKAGATWVEAAVVASER